MAGVLQEAAAKTAETQSKLANIGEGVTVNAGNGLAGVDVINEADAMRSTKADANKAVKKSVTLCSATVAYVTQTAAKQTAKTGKLVSFSAALDQIALSHRDSK